MRISVVQATLFLSISLSSCKKNASPSQPTDFSVTNSWECLIDGIQYTGSVDTSFLETIFHGYGTYAITDTIIYCTGTSLDKRANIHFLLTVNRTATGHDSVSTQFAQNEFDFDTSSANRLRAWANLGGITYHIEGLDETKMKGKFSGTAVGWFDGVTRTVTNGSFSFDIGRGDNEPKFLSCKSDNTPIRGYVTTASFISNTLIIDGLGFHADSTFKLMVRTGSQLRTGVFTSRNGDVGFQAYRPSIVTNFVSDTVGDFTVTIGSVAGNIVEGTFSGISQGFATGTSATIVNGLFKARVKNYSSQQDSSNKWGFVESNELQYPYDTWGGNILSAKKSQNGIWYYLLVNGESDNGKSNFKLKLSSTSPIVPGIYETINSSSNVDSIYFYSSPLNCTYYQSLYQGLVCRIDTIDNQRVVGHFYGRMNLLRNPNSALIYQVAMRKGYFSANF